MQRFAGKTALVTGAAGGIGAAIVRMLRAEEERIEPEKNPLVRLARRFFPVTQAYEGHHFFVARAIGADTVSARV